MFKLKKGAMFGLDCRTLRKQFGELFLVSRQSEDSKGASGSCGYTKRGAMFGLDARIALAIFGALSVISGAALYSAIQDAKATALISSMNEIGKAWEQYYLDTGVNLPQAEESDNLNYKFYQLRSNYLVEDSGVSGWNGPYINYEINGTSEFLRTETYPIIYLAMTTNEETWGLTAGTWDTGVCSSGKTCYNTVFMSGLNEDVAIAADKKIDNGDGGDKGKFRWYSREDISATRALLIYAPVNNPND